MNETVVMMLVFQECPPNRLRPIEPSDHPTLFWIVSPFYLPGYRVCPIEILQALALGPGNGVEMHLPIPAFIEGLPVIRLSIEAGCVLGLIALGHDSRVNRHHPLNFHPLFGLGVVFSSRSHG